VAAIPNTGELLTIFVWFAIIALAAVGGIYVLVAVRRWTRRDERPTTFTIQDLREMRDRGEISAQEFAAMRATILGQLQPTDSRRPPPSGEDDKLPEDDGSPSAS
jgi:hypothetical protein